MIKPNWRIFKAKFSDNPQDTFEWFCYLLFCREFKSEKGIFRFKNQSAIETDPVEIDGEVIGWQAKFYDTPLSKHKADLIKTIEKAIEVYPKISKFYLYSNQEWGQTDEGKSPQGKFDIENKAHRLGIKIEWNTASFFESEFVALKNENISKHFFQQDRSIFDQIEAVQRHSENILDDIRTSVEFENQNIEIDRAEVLKELKDELHQIVILSGVGGVGKTAVIKKLFEEYKNEIPFYIFKATEFELRSINDLLTDVSFQEFVDAHIGEKNKIIVIDSTEKLLYLKNTDPFKEFLRILINNKWRIFFTTRTDYLEVLNTEFCEIHRIIPKNLKIPILTSNEQDSISYQYDFPLPKDENLASLIKNPFYLNEYLRFYVEGEEIDYISFKKQLWNKIIKKAKPARETCFFKVALERANKGQFFINPSCESRILDDELKADGILGYETPHGYYITHDIYEEWALEKITESEFTKSESNKDFFSNLGQSLPVRRSFRNWLSEKLLIENDSIKDFIEEVVKDKDGEIESLWKDEIVVSVLLSDHSEYFFGVCKGELLKNNQEFLKRLTFLLRIACKELDSDMLQNLGLKRVNLFHLKYFLTKPRGRGWESLIKFVYENLKQIGISKIHFILPIIYDWNSKNKKGETVRYASLIALQYYEWMSQEGGFYLGDEIQNQLLYTIIYGSSEIKGELEGIFEKVIKNKWNKPGDSYYGLSKTVLTKLEGLHASEVLPISVLKLADLLWHSPQRENYYSYSVAGVDKYFDIKESITEYFPASAYQTPTYWLLKSSLKETIDFIILFTNKTVEAYASSNLDKGQVEEVVVFIDDGEPVKQYISNRLWCTYRGTQVLPHILESMHMALEKFFLEEGENANPEVLERWLLYLLKKSRSTSISAVVTSIVIAFPDKTFNVARVLFKTKDFFFYDTNRFRLDMTHKSSLSLFHGVNYRHEIYEKERLNACDAEHRKIALEHLCLNYQMFSTEELSQEEFEKRQKAIWDILDEHYNQLPEKKKQTERDKTWRLYLSRMDRRKMNPTTEVVDERVAIHFNPEVDPELLEYSEKSIKNSSEPIKYTSLEMWAELKMRRDDKHKKYEKYEKDPKLALKEVKEILSKLNGGKDSNSSSDLSSIDEAFNLINASIPGNVCSVLVRYHLETMTDEEQVFCKDIVIETASASIRPGYRYQIGDGSQFAISVLPILLDNFSEDREIVKFILLFTLFDEYPCGMQGTGFNSFAIDAIHELWEINFETAQSLLLGYLLLKPKYEKFRERLRIENFNKGVYNGYEDKEIEKFLSENEQAVRDVMENNDFLYDIGDLKAIDLRILKTAFLMLPLRTSNIEHKKIVREIIPPFAEKLLSRDRDDRIDHRVGHDFLEKLACFVLSCPVEEIEGYLKPFLDGFNGSEGIADLFVEIITAEDYLNAYDNFWKVWGLFKDKVIEICKKGNKVWYVDKILRSYLFAENLWKETTDKWHTLKDRDKRFFKELSQKIGHCPSTLYAISKLLNDIGTPYLNDGIFWVSDMLKKNPELLAADLVTNTIYYIENLTRKYIYNNREEIRRGSRSKKEVLVILDILILKGSVVGYMLRESIL